MNKNQTYTQGSFQTGSASSHNVLLRQKKKPTKTTVLNNTNHKYHTPNKLHQVYRSLPGEWKYIQHGTSYCTHHMPISVQALLMTGSKGSGVHTRWTRWNICMVWTCGDVTARVKTAKLLWLHQEIICMESFSILASLLLPAVGNKTYMKYSNVKYWNKAIISCMYLHITLWRMSTWFSYNYRTPQTPYKFVCTCTYAELVIMVTFEPSYI